MIANTRVSWHPIGRRAGPLLASDWHPIGLWLGILLVGELAGTLLNGDLVPIGRWAGTLLAGDLASYWSVSWHPLGWASTLLVGQLALYYKVCLYPFGYQRYLDISNSLFKKYENVNFQYLLIKIQCVDFVSNRLRKFNYGNVMQIFN